MLFVVPSHQLLGYMMISFHPQSHFKVKLPEGSPMPGMGAGACGAAGLGTIGGGCCCGGIIMGGGCCCGGGGGVGVACCGGCCGMLCG